MNSRERAALRAYIAKSLKDQRAKLGLSQREVLSRAHRSMRAAKEPKLLTLYSLRKHETKGDGWVVFVLHHWFALELDPEALARISPANELRKAGARKRKKAAQRNKAERRRS